MLLIVAACYVPTTVGLRTDGVLAAAGRGEAAVVVGEMLNDLGEDTWPTGPGYGGTGHYSVADGVAVSGSIARYDALSGAEGEVRVRAADEARAPLSITVLAGGGTVWGEGVTPTWGTHLGVVAGHGVGANLRTFVGARANPILANDLRDFKLFLDGGAGVSWRPPIGDKAAGLVLVEGDWIHGVQAGYEGSRLVDVNAYVVLAMLGMSWR